MHNILTPIVVLLLWVPCLAFQQKGGRESPPPVNSAGAKSTGRTHDRSRNGVPKPKQALAELAINVTPSDSTVRLDGVSHAVDGGTFVRVDLTPGRHQIVIHKDGYEDQDYEVDLVPGSNSPLNISLNRLVGTLTVTPTVMDAEINIVQLETNIVVGRYTGLARNVQLSPGRYQILVSKESHRTTVREVSVKPGDLVFLEPSLESLPKPEPVTSANSRQPQFHPDAQVQVQTSIEGKFVVLEIIGRSGDTGSQVGAVDITLTAGNQSRAAIVSGMLTGFPCQVDLVRLENVAELSFVESPGSANAWRRAVVRVRPKESKRAIHFLINWKSLGK
ncbi:MAG TPA: PEGA domain-containing protein [Pyrinomonadaceae bacterium]|nr:PEGA domain-containing protein [Pyrinomonadaceae bacterium]